MSRDDDNRLTLADIPIGFCQCGCGGRPSIAVTSNAPRGLVRGQPLRFLSGHHVRVRVEQTADRLRAARETRWAQYRANPPDWRPRFWSHVDRRGPDECWPWTGWIGANGYSKFRPVDSGKAVGVHRIAYELLVGPIPEGLTLDHLCRNPACVNPKHLEPVTMRENTLRGTSPIAGNARKTACAHGHPFDEANTRIDKRGARHCRACGRAKSALYLARKAAR